MNELLEEKLLLKMFLFSSACMDDDALGILEVNLQGNQPTGIWLHASLPFHFKGI